MLQIFTEHLLRAGDHGNWGSRDDQDLIPAPGSSPAQETTTTEGSRVQGAVLPSPALSTNRCPEPLEADNQRRLLEGAVRVKEPVRISQEKKGEKPNTSQPGSETAGVNENADSQAPSQTLHNLSLNKRSRSF